MEIRQYDIYLINLDPTIGFEIQKTRPCLIISPDEMNRNIQTIIVAPMTTRSHNYPTRVKVTFGKKTGWVVLDQIRALDRRRLVKRLGRVSDDIIIIIKAVIKEMLVD
ncbi:MAG: type II toxin-antitoxin system PemK/MazF family toxin [Candidatus Brocadiales bacterium]|nr:type II toxin-antitoxin system PemK/MazF family toxin [Candidatus Brocadiales bacterium]